MPYFLLKYNSSKSLTRASPLLHFRNLWNYQSQKLLYKQHITSNCTYSFVGKSLLIVQNTLLHKNLSLPQSELEWMFPVTRSPFIINFFLVYFFWLQNAILWQHAVLWHHAVLWQNAVLWQDAVLGQNAVLGQDAVLGQHVALWQHVVLWQNVHPGY